MQIYPQTKYLSTSDLCDRFRRSSRTIARWPKSRGFPEPVLQSVGAENLWLASDVEAWEAANLRSTFKRAG